MCYVVWREALEISSTSTMVKQRSDLVLEKSSLWFGQTHIISLTVCRHQIPRQS